MAQTHKSDPPKKKKALLAQINQLEAKLAELESKLAESEEEADLCLLQLHQVQEELEHYFLRGSELEAKISSLKAENKCIPDLKAKISSLKAESRAAQEQERRILVRLGQSEQLLSKAMKYIGSLRHNPRMPHRKPRLLLRDDHQGFLKKA